MGERGLIHDFFDSLAKSHAAEDLPFWGEAYRKLFPNMVGMHNHRQDGGHQRQGIDRTVVLSNSKVIKIDEKVRWRRYNDIALEYISNDRTGSPGWVCKPLLCDWIAYAIAPLGRCYLMPVEQLQSVWRKYGNEWVAESSNDYPAKGKRKHIVAPNKTYNTLSVAVERNELFPKIGGQLQVDFEPVENGAMTQRI